MGVYAKDFIKSEDESGCKWSEEVWFRPFPYCHFLRGNCRGAEKCPLIEVPEPHGDLIGREWLIDIAHHLMNTAKNDDVANGVKWLWQYIIDAPTIIPAEEGE